MVKLQFFLMAFCAAIGACGLKSKMMAPGSRKTSESAVGYSLSLDYGTVSIYFDNGNYIDAAKIEGGPAYKHLMRSGANFLDLFDYDNRPNSTASSPPTESAPEPQLQAQAQAQTQLAHRLDGSCLPSDSAQEDQDDLDADTLSTMLFALRTAAQVALDGPPWALPKAHVTAPYPTSNHFRELVGKASTDAGLDLAQLTKMPAGVFAAMETYDVSKISARFGDNWWTGGEQEILTLDYSRAALTGILFTEVDGAMGMSDVSHDTLLGSEALSKDPEHRHDRLVKRFRDLAHIEFRNGHNRTSTHTDTIVLLGESTRDPAFVKAFNEAFHPFFQIGTSRIGTRRLFARMDPTFVAARGLAKQQVDRAKLKEEYDYQQWHEENEILFRNWRPATPDDSAVSLYLADTNGVSSMEYTRWYTRWWNYLTSRPPAGPRVQRLPLAL